MLIANVQHTPAKQSKPTIVTINGWTCKKKDWEALVPLTEQGIGLFRFDRSGYVPGYFRTLVGEIAEELQERGIIKPDLVVHSMGGLVAIAYLNLVKEPGFERIRPNSVTFICPTLGDPREGLPKTDRLVELGSKFTRWRSNAMVREMNGGNLPYRDMWITLSAFQIASPLLFLHMKSDENVKREFARFLREAKAHDRRTTLMEFYAMCSEGRELGQKLVRGELWVPPKVLFVGGDHDLFVDSVDAAIKLNRALGNSSEVKLRIISDAGHFPMLEQPERFREMISEFI